VTSSVLLHDSGLPDHRLLARLVEAGTLVLDEHDGLRFASAGACDLLGASHEAELRAAWPALAAQLRVAQWPRRMVDGSAWHGRADVVTPRGPRAIRYELHVVDADANVHRAVLVRDRAHLLPTDRALLLASEAEANRHVLAGLVHAAKGPLNNFNLTLALLANLARANTQDADVAAKRARYLGVLQNEAARLASCIDEIHALTLRHAPAHETIDVAALSQDCARVLRHAATMREVSIDVDAPEHAVHVVADPQLMRLALLSFAIAVIELTSAGGRLGWRIAPPRDGAVRIVLTTSQPQLPRALVRALFRLSCIAESAYAAAIAARLIVEAQGGDVVVHDGNDDAPGIELALPADA
jgi:hypothetical protein